MKTDPLKIFQNEDKSFRLKPSRKLSVFLVCLFIATFFWLLNQLIKTYSIQVGVPLKYINLPTDRVVTNFLPDKLQFQIEGDGFNLLSVDEESEFDSVTIDIRKLQLLPNGNKDRAVISTQSIRDKVADKLGSKISVQQVSLDTISFVFEEKLIRTLPVKLNLNISAGNQYLLKGEIDYSPKEVKVQGPISILESLTNVETVYEEEVDVEESFDGRLKLMQPHSMLKMDYSEVEYRVEVESYTETEIAVPISVHNIPDSVQLTTFPSKAVIKYRVGLSMYNQIKQDKIKAFVDYSDIAEDQPSRVKVRLQNDLTDIEIVAVEPERVEYIIRK